eukprot:173889_1
MMNYNTTLQELLNDGLTREQAQSVIQASNDEDMKIQFDLPNEYSNEQMSEKINKICNQSEQINDIKTNIYISRQEIKLLSTIFANVIKYPNKNEHTSVNLENIISKINNYDTVIGILEESGFKWTDDGSRLIFDSKQHEQLQCVYINILSMQIYESNQYISDSLQKIDQLDSKHLLRPHRFMTRNICNLDTCESLTNINNVLLLYNSFIEGVSQINDEKNNILNISVTESVYNNID